MSGPKIAIFLPSLEAGGAERSMLSVANGIAERGYPVDLVLCSATGPFLAEVAPDVEIVSLGRNRVSRCIWRLADYLRRERPDVLLSAMTHANVAALIAARIAGARGRVVASERASHVRNVINEQASLRVLARNLTLESAVLKLAMRLTYKWADALITVSEDMVREFPGSRAIPNPIDMAELAARAASAPPHPWMQSERVILAAGRLVWQKDFATLMRAFAGMVTSAKLIILGEGPERPRLERLVREFGLEKRVALPGFDANPFAYMSRAALFVLSSRFEGLPGVLIQAMACGCPVVATDCPTGPREILEDGRWGDLVPLGDPAALAAAMDAALARDVHPDVRRRAKDYDVDSVIDRYLEILLPGETRGAKMAAAAGVSGLHGESARSGAASAD